MEIVKKNLFSIICGVIALIAIAAIPTFIRSQQKALQTKLDGRVKLFRDFHAVETKPRQQPVVSADANAAVPDLANFPGPKAIESGKAAIAQVQTQSMALEKMANEMNKHTLLVPNSLPNPSDTFAFQRAYEDALDNEIRKLLQSSTPPTTAEIEREKTALQQRMLAAAQRNEKGDILFKDAVDADIAKQVAELPEKMRKNAASQYKMYMAAGSALDRAPSIAGGNNAMTALPPEEIWLAQLGLWVQQDVCTGIAEINKASTSVATSPVKELVVIEIPRGREIYATPGSGGAANPMGAPQTGGVAANGPTDALPKDMTVSPTGRVCNGLFDVVHFTVCMNVDATQVSRIIEQLQRGRLLTVYWSDVVGINSVEKQQEGYFYGPVPVVTLTLKCEELFMRSWTRPLMPQSIKQYLNVQEAPQSTALAN
jgi:hypothetical protein